jgi:hypothetical protein
LNRQRLLGARRHFRGQRITGLAELEREIDGRGREDGRAGE